VTCSPRADYAILRPDLGHLEPQVTIGLLTGQAGFPLMVSAFEGNLAQLGLYMP
jgi:hypothetical protein